MTGRGLPAEIRRGIGAVSAATRDLVAAVGQADVDAVHRALERRASAIESLEGPMLELRRRADESGRLQLLEERASLEREAEQALEALQQLAGRMRGALEQLGRNASAVRSYADSSSPTTTLDRST